MVFHKPNCPLPPPDMVIQGAQFVYTPNFEGRIEGFNENGDRMFNVRIPDNILEQVEKDNWNVKWTKPGKNHPDPDSHVSEPYIPVHIGFKYRPPTISVFEDGNETVLTPGDPALGQPDTVKFVDALEFETMDMVIRGRPWENARDECGIKAWLKTFVGVVKVDEIQRKYARLRADA